MAQLLATSWFFLFQLLFDHARQVFKGIAFYEPAVYIHAWHTAHVNPGRLAHVICDLLLDGRVFDRGVELLGRLLLLRVEACKIRGKEGASLVDVVQNEGIEPHEAVAEEVIEAVGPGRDFLLEDHTLAHFRTEHYSSPLASRLNAATWEAAGAVDVLERAAAAVRDILGKPLEPRLQAAQTREVGRLQAQAEAALRDLPVRI